MAEMKMEGRAVDSEKAYAVAKSLVEYFDEVAADVQGGQTEDVIEQADGLFGDVETFLNDFRYSLGLRRKDYSSAPFQTNEFD